MKRNFLVSAFFLFIFLGVVLSQLNCGEQRNGDEMTNEEKIAHGKYLVNLGGCNDCHTPKTFTDRGPIDDTTRLLSGHPSNEVLANIDTVTIQPGKWYLANSHLTAWVGPWGISYTANLTPDEPTGLGNWTEEVFIKAIRTGQHMGAGRPILPPMPWQNFARLKDEDLKAIFAYLRSIPAIRNQIPEPVAPNMISTVSNNK